MNTYHKENYFRVSIIFILALTIPFTPYLSYIISLSLLLFLSSNASKLTSILIFMIGCFEQFFILHSRNYTIEKIYDLSAYYEAYNLMIGQSFYFLEYNTNEIGWFFIYQLIGNLFPNLSIYDIAAINTFLCLLLLTLWLILHGLKNIKHEYFGLILGCTLLFLWQPNFSFFQRQSLSIAILLFAISNVKNSKKYLFYLFLSTIFHLTSLLIGAIYYILFYLDKKGYKYKKYYFLILAVILVGMRMLFPVITNSITIFDIQDISKKINFYIGKSDFFLSISELRFLPLFILIFLRHKKFLHESWYSIMIFSALCYISLLGIQFASGRVNFILFYLYGYFLFFVCYNKPKILFIYIYVYLLFDICYKSSMIFDMNDFYWQRYPMFQWSPFYYIM